ncbi:MAG: 3-methyl-2-oxobutanoate dehydrogenase subunit VorB [Eubacteriaceae bacterium]|nr:3-methyl-2-oxobutanoate dehydrogenase subunit VorB [Eubacteriaceae bacterium]
MAKVLMKGNEAIGEAAIRGGCRYFFGYPITPQTELPEYMSVRLPEVGGVFLQAESEIAAINMLYGASGSGARAMTSSSSPGIALKQEGISYIAAAHLPCVIVNIVRGGPGLGGIQPAQSDYFQVTRGGGNGDYRLIVYAPANLQETVDIVTGAFETSEKYRVPVLVVGDGMIGQMMEPIDFGSEEAKEAQPKEWATTGTGGKRPPNIINSLYLDPQKLEDNNNALARVYREIEKHEVRVEEIGLENAECVVVAYGTTSRIVKTAIEELESEGRKIGLIRPITLWPYPYGSFDRINPGAKGILCAEMSLGQMIDDVKIGASGRWKTHFYGRSGGMVPDPDEIKEAILKIIEGEEA